MQAGPYR